jgi:hypothetical protein
MRGNSPPAAALSQPLGRLRETNSLRLAISLPLRNSNSLAGLLQRLYDPASPDYRHYLTPAQFSERFGPTVEDYQRVIQFARANNLVIESTHDSRILLDVRGSSSDVERAFHVILRSYQHPSEDRQFYAPDAEAWVDASLPIRDVAGLSDYALLRPALHKVPTEPDTGPAGGSGPGGYYMGQDFRNAYAPGVSLQGSGQMVGLFEADGYYASDIATYEEVAEITPVPLQNVLIDSFSGTPGSGNGEVAVDIETAISMSPGLVAVVVFESSNNVSDWLDILDRMASSNQIKQFSSSWGYTGGTDPNTAFDSSFEEMAAQGQSFFQASGDGDAWVTPVWVPADSPYVTSVGGTSLTMTGFGAGYSSETVWNSGNLGPTNIWFGGGNGYWGSGGGVSTVYSIPSWQQAVSMVANQGSTNRRNIPDVALTALDVWASYDNGTSGTYFGTSCSPPLWAGFAALANEQAAISDKPSVGFLNPAIYALGQGPNYGLCFHDVITGSNTSGGSPASFYAVPGYDLCTGWGTPAGSNLINALAGIYQPSITGQPTSQGSVVGSNVVLDVTATGATPLFYQWKFDGANIVGASDTNLDMTNLIRANAGSYDVVVTNQWGSLTSSVAILTVGQATPTLTWANPAAIIYGTSLNSSQLNATANVSGSFAYTPAIGSVLSAGTHTLTVIFTPTDTFDYRNATKTVSLAVSPASLTVAANNRTKTYGQTVTFAGTEFTAGGLVNGDTVSSATLASAGSAAAATAAGSPYNIVPSAAIGTGLTNYTIAYVDGGLTVAVAALTVTANNRTKTYGQTVTFAGTELTASGLLNTDAVSSVTLNSSGVAGAATVVGSPYIIVPSAAVGMGLNNYAITYANGTLTVSRAALMVTANNRTKTYGQTVTFAGTEFTTSGLVNGDTATSVTLSSSGTAASATVAGSPYIVVPSAAVGTGLSNYMISYTNGKLTVNPAALTVTANNRPKIYGQSIIFAGTEFTTSGLLNSDTVNSVTLSSSGTAAMAAVAGSPYSIAPSGAVGTGLANYTITYANGGLTVNPAALMVTSNNRTKTYGQTVTFVGTEFTASGLLNSDAVSSVTLTSSGVVAAATVAGSPYTIVASAAVGTGLSNYTITYANGALAVNTAALTVTANNRTKTYGQTLTFAGTEFTAGGLVNSDTATRVTLTSSGEAGTATVAASPYAIVPSAAVGAGLANYTITYFNGTLTVGEATPIATWSDPASIVYGSALNSSQLDATANVPGNLAYNPTNGSVLNAGTNELSVTFTPADTVNYSSVTDSVSLVVSPAPLTVTAGSTNRVYGQTNPVLIGTITGVTNGDDITATYGTTATISSPLGTYSIVPSLVDPGNRQTNYTVGLVDGVLTVEKATPITTWTHPAPIIYGAALTSNQLTAEVDVPGILAYNPTNGTVLNTGSNTLSVIFTPSDTVDYISVTDAVSLVVSPASLTVAASSFTRQFDEANPVFTGTITGLTNGDDITAAYSCSATTGSPVGTYAIVPSLVDPNDRQTNYMVNLVNGILVVGHPTEFFTWTNPTPVIYGTALTSNQLNAAVNVPGNYAYDPTNGAVLNTGTNTLSVIFTPIDAVDYNSVTDSVSLVVSPASLTITAADTNGVYGQANPMFTGTITGVTNGDDITTTYNCSATTTSPVGTYPIVPGMATGTDLTNYTITYASGTLTINPAALTITANDRAKPYGQTVTFAGTEFMTGGLVNGDTVTDVMLTSSAAAATATVLGSPYAIVPSGAVGTGLNNYTVTYVNGTLTINPATLTITADNRTKTYGQPVIFAGTEYTTSELANSDTITGVTLTSPGAPATATAVGSPYAIVPSGAAGMGLSNYAITYASGALTVSPAALTVTANNRTKTYGQTETFAGTEFTSSGLLNTDTVNSATLTSSGAMATAPVVGSPYIIVPSAAAGTGLNNYAITYVDGGLTVNPAPLSVTASNGAKTYGQTVTFAGTEFAANGLLNSDTVNSASLNSSGAAATATVVGSPYTIVPSAAVGTGLNNYTITYASGTLTVNPAALTVTANNRTKTYGQPVIFAGTEYTTSGLANSDAITSVALTSPGAPATATAVGSPYTIVASGAAGTGLSNYTITYANGSMTVDPAALTVTANNQTKTYGQSVTFAGTEFVTGGLVNGDTVNSATLNSSGAAAMATVMGSPYAIVPSSAAGTGLNNYTITYASGMMTINRAALTITADNRTKTYGQPVIFAGTEFTTGVLANSDTVTSVTLASSGSAATATVVGSPYNIAPNAAVGTGLGNYMIAYANGALTVSPASLTVTNLLALDKVYDATTNAILDATNAGVSGALNGDSISLVTTNAVAYFANKNVGTNKPVTVSGLTLGGASAGNYILTQSSILSANITAATVTIASGITANSKVYDGTTIATLSTNNVTLSGVFNVDTVKLNTNGYVARFASASVGNGIAVTVSGLTLGGGGAGNYTLTQPKSLVADITSPSVQILASMPNIVITWPANATDYVLNRTASLASPVTWLPVTNGITLNGINNTVIINASSGVQYFELLATP